MLYIACMGKSHVSADIESIYDHVMKKMKGEGPIQEILIALVKLGFGHKNILQDDFIKCKQICTRPNQILVDSKNVTLTVCSKCNKIVEPSK